MQEAWLVVKIALAAVVGLLAWNLAAHVFLINTVGSPSFQAEGELLKMEREAQVAYKGLPNGLATSRYASERASKELAAAQSQEERAFKAAQIFIGFYLTHTRARAEFCKEQKVDISNFVDEFSRIHRLQYERAVPLLQAQGLSVDKIWSIHRGAMAHAVQQDMWPLGSIGMTMSKACEEIAHRPRTYADKLNLIDRQPDVQRALMGS